MNETESMTDRPCSKSPGATHYAGCQCHEQGWRERLKAAESERDALRVAILETLMENRHLADGEQCTLKRLKDAIGFEFPPE